MLSTLVYIVAYAGLALCIGLVGYKCLNYMKKPVHLRWELYPIPHEGARAEHGGSYLEDYEWWKKEREHSFIGMVKGLCIEMLFMHSTYENNRPLWVRSYPFHAGLYLIIASIFLAIFTVILGWVFESITLVNFFAKVIAILTNLGFLGVMAGTAALTHRRLHDPDLRRYTTREHFLNLIIFNVFGLLGMLAWYLTPSFGHYFIVFFHGMLTFEFRLMGAMPDSTLFMIFMAYAFIIAAYVPATHMAHFFMKYFLYHDIRWGDTPTQDSDAIKAKIGQVLGYSVDWKAPHIGADGKKNWAEIATTNPAKKD